MKGHKLSKTPKFTRIDVLVTFLGLFSASTGKRGDIFCIGLWFGFAGRTITRYCMANAEQGRDIGRSGSHG
jgi:hypothetical protein